MTQLRGVANVDDAYLAAISDMPEAYLECRGSQHRMEITDPFRVVDSRSEQGAQPHMGHDVYAKRVLVCDRCGMERRDFYAITSRRGHTMLVKINATYSPPEGYAISGLGRVAGSRGLVLGMELEHQIQATKTRGRGRPRKGGDAS